MLDLSLKLGFRNIMSSGIKTSDSRAVLWLDPNTLSTVTKDISDKVSQLDDQSSSGIDVVQALADNQPTYDSGTLVFDGNDVMSASASAAITFTKDFSIAVKFKVAVGGGSSYLISKSDADGSDESYAIRFSGSGQNLSLYFDGVAKYTMDSSSITDDTEYTVVFTWDGTTIKCYKNGALHGSATYNFEIVNDGDNIYIGALATGSEFEGTIYSVKIFNDVLEIGDINKL